MGLARAVGCAKPLYDTLYARHRELGADPSNRAIMQRLATLRAVVSPGVV